MIVIGSPKKIQELLMNVDNVQHDKILSDNNISTEVKFNKIKAAYALNLCTVSISQIVDYNDINILEQEYEAILNNLNLEVMPKDESLLRILKQILDTITFFRIQEGDKKFIERDYQQKMKNAIWSSVPNLSVIFTGGNPFAMLGALAIQVGIGYMNYRKEKANIENEFEKEKWQLQRSAIEQFNGLRRELFDTAWRLAEKYKFDDKYRLTEKQISQYNEIILDPDYIRRYERLDAIQECFDAYAPFWYYFGDAACQIVNNADKWFEEDEIDVIKNSYIEKATKSFDKFYEINNFSTSKNNTGNSLLRVDQIACSCYLEHIDLLNPNDEKEKIKRLLDKTIDASGHANDILQICAMDYLKIGEYELAKKYLRILVIEHFNKNTNAQILSHLYLDEVINDRSKYNENMSKYETLKRFVPEEYLYPLPKSIKENDLNTEEFFNSYNMIQKYILLKKYTLAYIALIRKFVVNCNRKLQNIDFDKPDSYFFDDKKSKTNRYSEIKNIIKDRNKKNRYLEILSSNLVSATFITNLNEFYGAFQNLVFLNDVGKDKIENKLNNEKSKFGEVDNKILTDVEKKGLEDDIQNFFFEDFINEYIKEIVETTFKYVNDMKTLNDYIEAENQLRNFCISSEIPEPDILFESPNHYDNTSNEMYFDFEEYGSTTAINERERINKRNEQIEIIKPYMSLISNDNKKLELCIKGDSAYSSFISKNEIRYEMQRDLIAILISKKGVWPKHLLFTTDRLFLVKGGKNTWGSGVKYSYLSNPNPIDNKFLNGNELLELVKKLSENLSGYDDVKNEILENDSTNDDEYIYMNHGLSTETTKIICSKLLSEDEKYLLENKKR